MFEKINHPYQQLLKSSLLLTLLLLEVSLFEQTEIIKVKDVNFKIKCIDQKLMLLLRYKIRMMTKSYKDTQPYL